jgi:hypothetical protein
MMVLVSLVPGTSRVREAVLEYLLQVGRLDLVNRIEVLIEGDGFIFTGADCRGWMAETGFSESYVEHLVGPDSMIVGIK